MLIRAIRILKGPEGEIWYDKTWSSSTIMNILNFKTGHSHSAQLFKSDFEFSVYFKDDVIFLFYFRYVFNPLYIVINS